MVPIPANLEMDFSVDIMDTYDNSFDKKKKHHHHKKNNPIKNEVQLNTVEKVEKIKKKSNSCCF